MLDMPISEWSPDECFLFDRAMSLHRRAYGLSLPDWIKLAHQLNCAQEAIIQIWETAQAAIAAGMTKEFAFPLVAEILKKESAIDASQTFSVHGKRPD